jgi:hypothetical protein
MRRRALLWGLGALIVAACAAVPAAALAAPEYDVKATWSDTILPPGGEGDFDIWIHDLADPPGAEDLFVEDRLPEGVSATGIYFSRIGNQNLGEGELYCSGVGTETVQCDFPAAVVSELMQAPGAQAGDTARPTGFFPQIAIGVAIDPAAEGGGANTTTVSGAGATGPDSDTDEISFGVDPHRFGIVPGSLEADLFDAAFPFGEPSRQAADHPYELRVDFDLNLHVGPAGPNSVGPVKGYPDGSLATVEATVPRGMIGNPEALPKCDPVKFAENGATGNSTACPADTQVGYLNAETASYFANHSGLTRVAVYNLEPPRGQAADFGFNAQNFVRGHIYPTLDPAQNYAIKTLTPDISNLVPVTGSEVTFWGVPGDPAHDKFRYFPKVQEGNIALGAPFEAPIEPLLTNPADCGFDNGGTRIRLESYNEPGRFTPIEEAKQPLNVGGCDDPRFRFEPEVSLQPTSRAAGGPTGLDVHLKVPQRDEEVEQAKQLYAQNDDVKGISTPPIKKAVVTLPQGMTVNPAAAQGLAACTPAQIGLGTDSPVSCPDASQFGTLVLHTPLLPAGAQPEGWIYIAKQNDNPFQNFLSLYLVIQEPERGILIKVPGRVDLDPQTGQITTTFDDLPQFPLSDMQLSLKGGLRAGLVNPQTCGKKTIEASFYSWQDPTTPITVDSNYEITQNSDGSACFESLSERPFAPELSGGTLNNRAGSYSPMELRLTRGDGDQELSRVEGTSPPGLLASLRGVGRCSDAAIAAAADPGRTGTDEIEHPSCPASSLVGSVDAGAGVGQVLTYVKGRIYLAGPYKGAPVSGVAIVPAVAGPFDLGTIVTRAPGYVNPRTAELHLVTDPLPLIFKGVPVRVRDIQVHLDRPRFTLNPTSCAPFALSGTLFSSEGKSKADGSGFQAAECASLGFKPHLSTRLYGGTRRGSHPKFRGVYRAREGDANAAAAVVTLPHSEFLDQAHIRTVCTRVQFAAGGGNGAGCPPGSIYGHAAATTPLLDETLSGPVYLRSSSHKLPDLVAALHGIVDVEVDGRIDSIGGGIRANFESIPDAPVSSFTITMRGGKKGLLVNSRSICAHTYRIDAGFKAQNGKEATLEPSLQAKCGHKGRAKRR